MAGIHWWQSPMRVCMYAHHPSTARTCAGLAAHQHLCMHAAAYTYSMWPAHRTVVRTCTSNDCLARCVGAAASAAGALGGFAGPAMSSSGRSSSESPPAAAAAATLLPASCHNMGWQQQEHPASLSEPAAVGRWHPMYLAVRQVQARHRQLVHAATGHYAALSTVCSCTMRHHSTCVPPAAAAAWPPPPPAASFEEHTPHTCMHPSSMMSTA
jgi:hypothetical protein